MADIEKKSTGGSSIHLERTHGLKNTLNLFFGIIIGSGIFISVNSLAKETPSSGAAIAMWLVMGAYSLLGSVCFAELGTDLGTSRSFFTYFRAKIGIHLHVAVSKN